MKLLIDAHCFDQVSTEGINTHIKGIYTHMPALAPDIEFYFAAADTSRLHQVFGAAPNIRFVKLRNSGRLSRMMLEFPDIIRKLGIDAAHFQYFAPPFKNCRTIVTLHDLLFKDFPASFPHSYRLSRDIVFRHSARRADIIATVSDYSRSRIAAHYGISADRILLTPNAVADDFFEIDRMQALNHILARGVRPFILNVSRIEPRKNQISVAKAFVELGLARRGLDLVFINQPTIPVRDFEHFIASLPEDVRCRVHRIGAVSHEELKLWYGAASLFVYPSLAEGFGIPPLEAAAAMTPTICHDSTAMSEFRFLGPNLADLSKPENLKKLILSNIDNPPSADRLAEISDAVRQRYSWKASAESLLEAIRSL